MIGSLPTSGMDNLTLDATSATQAWTKSIARRQNFIAKLDQYSLYSQQLGESSIDFKIQRIQHGTVYSEPASSISFDIWLRPGGSIDVERDVRLKVSSEISKAVSTPNDPPMIVKFSPSWMSRSFELRKRVDDGFHTPISAAVTIGPPADLRQISKSPRIFEGESMRPSQSMTTLWTVRAISSPKDRQIIGWHIRKFKDPYSSESSLHVRMAVIVEHGNRPFSLEVELPGSRKSRLQKLAIVRERPPVNKIRIIPETGSGLEVDLDQPKYMVDPLLEVQNNVGENEVGEVGLEYDGKHFTMRVPNESE